MWKLRFRGVNWFSQSQRINGTEKGFEPSTPVPLPVLYGQSDCLKCHWVPTAQLWLLTSWFHGQGVLVIKRYILFLKSF